MGIADSGGMDGFTRPSDGAIQGISGTCAAARRRRASGIRTACAILALAGLLWGCGDTRPRVVDPLLLPFVEEFEAAAGFPVGSSVVFGDVTVLFGGLCYPNDRLVVIPNAKRESSDTALMIAVFHELGHCELGRIEHTEGYIDPVDGVPEVDVPGLGTRKCPVSIMSSRAPIPLCFEANRDYYLDELFNGPW